MRLQPLPERGRVRGPAERVPLRVPARHPRASVPRRGRPVQPLALRTRGLRGAAGRVGLILHYSAPALSASLWVKPFSPTRAIGRLPPHSPSDQSKRLTAIPLFWAPMGPDGPPDYIFSTFSIFLEILDGAGSCWAWN